MKLSELKKQVEAEGQTIRHPIEDPCRLLGFPCAPKKRLIEVKSRVKVIPKDGSTPYHLVILDDEACPGKLKYVKMFEDGHLEDPRGGRLDGHLGGVEG